MRRNGDGGFSLVELLVSIAIMVGVVSAIFGLTHPGYGVFDLELERTDMEQRLRASFDMMFKDLVMAGARSQEPAIAPFRRGDASPDPAGSAFSDRLSVLYVPPDGTAGDAIAITYWRQPGDVDGPRLMRYDGHQSDVPVADYVTGLRFEYFDGSGSAVELGRLTDGPWVPDGGARNRFDADLLRIRRVRVVLRVGPARQLLSRPLEAQEMVMDIAPRNLNLP